MDSQEGEAAGQGAFDVAAERATPSLTLGRPTDAQVFVTDATSVRGLNATEIATKLGIPESPTGYQVIEFPSGAAGPVPTPIASDKPGFVGGGRTVGRVPEFNVPNGPIPEGAVITDIPPVFL